jgi:RNA polymerase sigma-70 factor (ECF subfamily)
MSAADEQRLIDQVKDRNHAAFRILVERYMKHAYNVAFGFLNSHDDAEDVAQEAFVRVYNSIGSFRGDAVFSTWLYRIVANISLNRIRQRKSKAKFEVRVIDSYDIHPVEATVDCYQQDVQVHVERALHELPTLQRAVVILRHLNGMSTRQVSDILQCSEGTVKTHLHRGLKKMRQKVGFLKDEVA